ncbi:MAG: PhoH family protein [Bacteroidota bacterium]|nr:PhoH family protein [Bacteroidota bacterium]
MLEKTINLEAYSVIDLFGVNDRHLNEIKDCFPNLKIVARGEMLKVSGEETAVANFDKRFHLLLAQFEHFGKISDIDIRQILQSEDEDQPVQKPDTDVLVHGRGGMIIKAKTPNQQKIVDAFKNNDIVFAVGPAGTGKTYTAVALAVRALKNKEVRRIVLTRPAVEAGESLGFLPGDLKEKLDPYLQPLYDALRDMLPPQKLITYLEDGTIEIAPLAFMRGRTLDNAFVILDEAQNTTANQIKMFLTRMGKTSKFMVTGDITQIDLPRNQKSGLVHSSQILKDIEGIAVVQLDSSDVVRHKLVALIINAYERDAELSNYETSMVKDHKQR